MRKILTLAVAALLIFSATPPRPAHAWESLVTVLPTPLAVGTTLAPLVIFTVIATGTHFPLCDVSGVTCEFTYPGDEKRFGSVQAVAYEAPVPNSAKYDYQDATGVHKHSKH
jgi:hypothetical protein